MQSSYFRKSPHNHIIIPQHFFYCVYPQHRNQRNLLCIPATSEPKDKKQNIMTCIAPICCLFNATNEPRCDRISMASQGNEFRLAHFHKSISWFHYYLELVKFYPDILFIIMYLYFFLFLQDEYEGNLDTPIACFGTLLLTTS